MTPSSTQPHVFDEKLVNASFSVTKALFEEANGDVATFINKLINEKGENKNKAFSIILGFSQTGLLPKDELILILSRISPTEKEKASVLVSSYMKSNPGDSDSIALMDQLNESFPELIADVIEAKKNWDRKDIRRYLVKYLYSEALWLRLATIEEELKSRK